ncbi:MAG: flavodoxin family protein, partial [Proteobacteria bacterium]|nr:flavodoxin family protein [Pseudomonadota bacterium]
MKTDLFYCTGTGNSLWVARMLAKELGDARIYPMNRIPGQSIANGADAVGVIFPVHIWGLPSRVIAFVDTLAEDPTPYHFAIAVNAGQVAATLVQLKRLMRAKGLSLLSGFEIAMPSNYIPWGGPGPEKKRLARFDKARQKIGEIAVAV